MTAEPSLTTERKDHAPAEEHVESAYIIQRKKLFEQMRDVFRQTVL